MKQLLLLVALALVAGACGSDSAAPPVTIADLPAAEAPTTTAAEVTTTSAAPSTTTTTRPPDDPIEFGTPVIAGDPLPFLEDAEDAAIGLVAPEVTGTDFFGNPVAIEHGEMARAIVFLAHWCPHCQEELPEVTALLESGGVEGVEIIAIATGSNETRPNFPPSAWFADEGWPAEVIVDDEDFNVLRAYGGPAFPFWTFLTSDGRVALRIAGRVDQGTLVTLLSELAEL